MHISGVYYSKSLTQLRPHKIKYVSGPSFLQKLTRPPGFLFLIFFLNLVSTLVFIVNDFIVHIFQVFIHI